MGLNTIQIFILPVCDFSFEESQNFSLDELTELWKKGKVTKYKLFGFLQDVDDDMLIDNINNWIVVHGLPKTAEDIKQAV